MTMKSSRYNLFFKTKDGRYLLVNTFSRSKVYVDDELKEVLEHGVFDDVDPHIVEQLHTLGVVSETDEHKKFTDMYKKRVYTPFEYEFTIFPTSQCNLACYYCSRSEKTFSRKTFQLFKEFFSQELERGEFPNVAVRIAGGEPLFHPELLFEILDELSKITEEYSKTFFSGLATNGTLLTPQILDRLSFLNAVQVTFEGCRSYHNTVRVDTAGTFDRVLKSAEMIQDAGIFLNMRVHVSEKNTAGLEELFSELQSSVGVGPDAKTMITAAPVAPTRICPIHPLRCTETVEAADLLPKSWEAAKKSGIMISGMPSPAYEMLPCPYVTPTSLIVDPEGTFYTCLIHASEGTNAAGSVREGLYSETHTLEQWDQECENCPLLVLCGGRCSGRRQDASTCENRAQLTERLRFYLKTHHPLL